MGVPLDDWDCVWVDPSPIELHNSFGSDARDLQCDFVHVPGFVDNKGGRALVQMSPQGTSFAWARSL